MALVGDGPFGLLGRVVDYFGSARRSLRAGLGARTMPGASGSGFPPQYAENVLSRAQPGAALLHMSETRPLAIDLGGPRGACTRAGDRMRALGVRPGDRVVAWMPNIPETMVAMLAATAIGAIWACCSPDFGRAGARPARSLDPTVLFCVDGYRYGGKEYDRREELQRIRGELRGLKHVIHLPYLRKDAASKGNTLARGSRACACLRAEFRFEQVRSSPALDPLFLRHDRPAEAIVHGHGGILLETQKNASSISICIPATGCSSSRRRLDAVEFRRQLAPRGRHSGSLRRSPAFPQPESCGSCAGRARDAVRREPDLRRAARHGPESCPVIATTSMR